MRIIFTLLILAGILFLTVPVTAEYTQWCPFPEEEAGLSIGGYQIDAGLSSHSVVQNGIILSSMDVWQQAGEGEKVAAGDSITEGQGYANQLNGQGSWSYGWNLTVDGNDIDTDRLLTITAGRLNPGEEQYMMSYACPPDTNNPYTDNLTHVTGAESAYAANYADLLQNAGYATKGSIGPGALSTDVAFAGQGMISVHGGYNTMTGIAVNKTVPVTTYVLQGRIMVPVTTLENQTVTAKTGHTILNFRESIIADSINYGHSFRYQGTRSSPY